MTYIDGFVYAVSKDRKDEFVKYAQACAEIFKNHGAQRVTECWAEDVPDGKVTSFPMSVKKKTTEAVLFSWIEWPSKKARNEAYETMMPDFKAANLTEMPFDGKRMIHGGFTPVVDE